jgi:alpha/beta superfamily hydrolase
MTAPSERCVVQVAGLTLEARFTPASGTLGAVVAPPHPLYGGTLSNPVVVAATEGLGDAGIATLAFNYRGTEDSEGVASDSLEASAADYQAAFGELCARVAGPYYAAGYSFGAGTALVSMRDDPRVRGLVLLSPPCGMLREEDLVAFSGPLLVIVGDDDEYAPLDALKKLLAVRPECSLEVITGADHFFHFGGLTEIRKLVARHVKAWI